MAKSDYRKRLVDYKDEQRSPTPDEQKKTKNKKKSKPYSIYHKYRGNSPVFRRHWGDWEKYGSYAKEKNAQEALKALKKNKKDSDWEYRLEENE